MKLKAILMQYLRKGKQLADKALVVADSYSNSPTLAKLQINTYYGYPSDITSVDQLGNPDPDKVTSYYGPINDIKAAQRFGTNNLEEYSYWAWRSCGVANVATILRTAGLYSGTLYELVKEIELADGYLKSNRWGDSDIGWKHESLRQALITHGVKASLAPRLSVQGLIANVSEGAMIIASIKSRISAEGSHMVLVFGVNWQNNNSTLFIYDPYTLDGKGGIKTLSLNEFSTYFLNRGIITWPQITASQES